MVAAETRRTVAGMAAFVGIPCHRWAAVDVETTGFDPRYGRVVEIGVILVDDGRVTDIFDTLINPGIGPGPIHTHGNTPAMLAGVPRFGDIAAALAEALDGRVLVGHNLSFDTRFLGTEFDRAGGNFIPGRGVCTMRQIGGSLQQAARKAGVRSRRAHRALHDAETAAHIAARLARWHNTRPADVWIFDNAACPTPLHPREAARAA